MFELVKAEKALLSDRGSVLGALGLAQRVLRLAAASRTSESEG